MNKLKKYSYFQHGHIINNVSMNLMKPFIKNKRLNIPNSYHVTYIKQKALTLIINKLSFIFKNLNINKIKDKKGTLN